MSWLGRFTTVVEVTFCWALGVLAGGVVLGWMPAGVAAGDVLHRLTGPDPSDRPIRDFFAIWRTQFVRSNAVGWPATLALLVLAVNISVLWQGGEPWMASFLPASILTGLLLVLGTGFLMALLALPETRLESARRLWRTALVMPVVSPATTLVWLFCMALLGVVAWNVPVVAVIAGPGYVALVTAWLARRRLVQTGVVDDPDRPEDEPQADDSRPMTSKSA